MFAHEKRTAQNPRRFREPTRKTTVAFHCSTFRFRMGLHGSIWSRLTEKKQPSRSPEYLDTVGVTGSNRVSRTRRSVMLAYTYVLRCCDGDMYGWFDVGLEAPCHRARGGKSAGDCSSVTKGCFASKCRSSVSINLSSLRRRPVCAAVR
jgi:hypothetical protein